MKNQNKDNRIVSAFFLLLLSLLSIEVSADGYLMPTEGVNSDINIENHWQVPATIESPIIYYPSDNASLSHVTELDQANMWRCEQSDDFRLTLSESAIVRLEIDNEVMIDDVEVARGTTTYSFPDLTRSQDRGQPYLFD